MRIMFMISDLCGGGAEKVLKDIVNHLDFNRYEITVYSLFNRGIYREQLNSNIHYESFIKKPSRLKNALFWRVVRYFPSRWVYRLIVRKKYDVEIAFLEGLSTKIISGSNQISQKIAWVHTDLMHHNHIEHIFLSNNQHRLCYMAFNHIVCVSETVKKEFINLFRIDRNLSVIHNLIDAEQIREKATQFISGMDFSNNSLSEPIICSIGRLEEVKGYLRLLEIHKHLLDQNIRHRLWIIGEGSQREELEKYISENDLQNSVTLWGFRENPYPFLLASDIFVSSSFAEGYSLAIAEALVLKKPIICTICAGSYELLANGKYGLLTENSSKGLYSGIYEVLKNPTAFDDLKKKALLGASQFSINNIINKIEALFK